MEAFDYPFFSRLIRISSLIAALIIAVIVLTSNSLTLLTAFTKFTLPQNMSVPANLSIIFISIVVVILVIGIALVNHLLFPAIRISDEGFQLSTEIYKSRWFGWNELNYVKEHWLSSRRRRMFGFVVKGLPVIFSLIGLVQRYNEPVFLINDKLRNYNRFMQIAREKRPDLFESIAS
jgi:hypothetical protein